MGEKTIQKIPVLPFAKMLAVISAIIGLIIAIISALGFEGLAFFISSMLEFLPGTAIASFIKQLFTAIGVGAVILIPIIGFIGGLVLGSVVAALYNFLAPRVGGIRLRVKEESPTEPKC